MYWISYKLIIIWHERHYFGQNRAISDIHKMISYGSIIPYIIKKLMPTLSVDQYQKSRFADEFTSINIEICEACYLHYTSSIALKSVQPSKKAFSRSVNI